MTDADMAAKSSALAIEQWRQSLADSRQIDARIRLVSGILARSIAAHRHGHAGYGRLPAGAAAFRDRPDLQVLYLSGYTDDDWLRQAIQTDHLAYLQKPVSPAVLAAKVRETLDGKASHQPQ